MGDPKKQRKKYETPRHPWRIDQLDVELRLIGDYGLRNKRELWRYKTLLSRIRGMARSLLAETEEERESHQKAYMEKMARLGLLGEEGSIDDILDLDIKDLIEKRLQTVVYRMGLAKSIHQARQMITHGHIMVADRRVTIPGYLVKKGEEGQLKLVDSSPFNRPNASVPSMSEGDKGRTEQTDE